MYHVVVGVRHSGKGFHLYQMIREPVEKGLDSRRIFNFDFSDDRLEPITPSCGTDVTEEHQRRVPEARELGACLFLDEVRELDDWRGLLKRLAQSEKVTLVVTGSSPKLSSEELGAKSRGRSHGHVLLPLPFGECCRFAGEDVLAESAAQDAALSRADEARLSGLRRRLSKAVAAPREPPGPAAARGSTCRVDGPLGIGHPAHPFGGAGGSA